MCWIYKGLLMGEAVSILKKEKSIEEFSLDVKFQCKPSLIFSL